MALISFSAFGRGREDHADWRQDEIAELYRVLHLLQKAGLSIDYDRGVTDIGEPWFVFFDPTGDDVFLHVARLGGRYILVSDVLDLKVEGRDLRSASTRLEQAVEKVILGNRERNSKVIAHPAAQMMLSIAAVFLIIKSKAAHAASDDDHTSDGSLDASAKIRGLINRLHDAIDNPALVAAMVSAIVLSTTSHIGDSENSTDLKELINTASRDYTDGDAASIHNSHSALASDSVDVADAAGAHVNHDEPDGTSHAGAADASNLTVAVNSFESLPRNVEVEAKLDEVGGNLVPAGHGTDASSNDTVAVQTENLNAEHAKAVIQNGGTGASEATSELLVALSSGGDSLLELASSTSLELTAVVKIAESTSMLDVVSALADTGDDTGTASSVIVASSDSDTSASKMPTVQTMSGDTAPDASFDAFFELIQLFGEVHVYAYGQNHVLIVDADVQNMSGGDLAFVTEEIHDGFEISLVGSREIIGSYGPDGAVA